MFVGLRRSLGVLTLSTMLGVAGSFAGATVASAANNGSATPGTPQSTTPGAQVRGEHFTRYCVKHYPPNSNVTVTNQKTGQTRTIHTNASGSGCTEVPVTTGCQVISANGTGDSSAARVCVLGEQVSRSGSGSLPFTGSNDIVPGILIGSLLIVVGSGTVVMARRRRGVSTV